MRYPSLIPSFDAGAWVVFEALAATVGVESRSDRQVLFPRYADYYALLSRLPRRLRRQLQRRWRRSLKLSTWRDGLRILLTIVSLFKEERPLAFFTGLFALLFGTALALAYLIVVSWLETGLVPRFPTAILATGITVLAFLSLASGVILDTVTRGRREFRHLAYLAIPPVGETRGAGHDALSALLYRRLRRACGGCGRVGTRRAPDRHGPWFGRVLSYLAAATVTWALNRRFTCLEY